MKKGRGTKVALLKFTCKECGTVGWGELTKTDLKILRARLAFPDGLP